jgi:glycosyltransferase involved in cell wall biosynthesis
MAGKRIGFVSMRLAGTDGVSLEASKWADVLVRDGHYCAYMAGEVDTPEEDSFVVPECHFTHPRVHELYRACFGRDTRTRATTRHVEEVKHELKEKLQVFVDRWNLDMLIPENAVTIPLNIPLGLALAEFALETGMPMIAHHHDFFWERKRFLHNACWDYLRAAFPPPLAQFQHAVLNTSQRHQLSLRTGIGAVMIPNVMDFETPPPPPDGYEDDLRESLGIGPDEKFILQPTRVVQRKGIERAVELVSRLGVPACLVVSHASGDEGDDYAVRVREYSQHLKVKTIFCESILGEQRGTHADGRKIYTLADMYRACDLVTYPSRIEGFGNAFLEAIYYRRPIMVNNYSIYQYDIRPKGFRTIEMEEYVSARVVRQARDVLENPELGVAMTEHNYRLAERFFSYGVLRQNLQTMLVACFGSYA